MIKNYEVLETIRMIDEDKFDVRTITMGISLLDCVDADMDRLNEKIYQKIYSKAEHLVAVGEQLEKEYGVTIVNKRISVTPIALVVPSKNVADFIRIAHTLDKVALDTGVNFIGGFSGLVQKGMTDADKALIKAIPQALASTQRVCASLNVGSTKAGINMNAVRMVGDMLLECAHLTKDTNSNGCTKFVVFTNAVDDNPFMAGAYHGVGEPDCVVSVGVSGPGVVKRALREVHHQSFETLCDAIKKSAFKITRIGQLIGLEAARRLGVDFGIIDLSLAPTPAVGDSIAEIFNEMGLEYAGAPGTTAALALLNDSVKKGGLMASSHVGGLSGAFIPVSEDQGMIEAVQAGYLSLEKLEAMTCVCSVGLDMVAVPGSTSADTLAGLIADEMAIGMINQKTTAVRIIPVIGKEVGDVVEFGGLLGTAPIMHINSANCSAFVNRGGFIPAPLHSFKN